MIPNIYTWNMYSLRKLKDELLMKAYQSIAGKVTVKRLHHPKDGSQPYWETHHVLPDKVESGDVVLANHHLLPPNHPQYKAAPQHTPAPKKPHGNAIPDEIRAKVNAWEQKNFTDRSSLLSALKQMGISWKESDKAGINLMRAKQALGHAIMEKRFDPDDPNAKVLPVAPQSPAQVPSTAKSGSGKISDSAKAAAKDFFKTDCKGD